MAELASGSGTTARVDEFLDYLIAEWSAVPALAAEWPTWDEHLRLSFVLDWAVRENPLGQLRRDAELQLLTAHQHARYERLQQLVARHRPILDRLLADESTDSQYAANP
jgi:hypothetical protein